MLQRTVTFCDANSIIEVDSNLSSPKSAKSQTFPPTHSPHTFHLLVQQTLAQTDYPQLPRRRQSASKTKLIQVIGIVRKGLKWTFQKTVERERGVRMLKRIEGVFEEREEKWSVEEEEEDLKRGVVGKGEGRLVGGGNVGVGFKAEKQEGDEKEGIEGGRRGQSGGEREGERQAV